MAVLWYSRFVIEMLCKLQGIDEIGGSRCGIQKVAKRFKTLYDLAYKKSFGFVLEGYRRAMIIRDTARLGRQGNASWLIELAH